MIAKNSLNEKKKNKVTTLNNARINRSELEQRNRELIQELSFYHSIVEEQSDPICQYGVDARIVYANRAFCEMFGFDVQQFHSMSLLQLVADTNHRLIGRHWPEYTRQKPQSAFELRMKKPDGATSWFRWTERALFDDSNSIVGFQSVGRDINDRKRAEDAIDYLKNHDPLTGCFNRAYLNGELKNVDVPSCLPISVIVCNINGLKLVNDTFGYPAGDRLLINTAGILKSNCRPENKIVRFGGDQFVVLLRNTSAQEAAEICDNIQQACLMFPAEPVQPCLALGTATKDYSRKHLDEVLSEAEDVMFRAKLLESRSTKNALISSLETTLHEKTTETREHAERLQYMSLQFGKVLGLAGDAMDRLALLAKLHDIGKIAIPEAILTKPGPLNDLEWDIIKKHPEIGFRIAQASRELAVLAEEVLAHHERWDGAGYPKGLAGERIPLLARIISIIDAFDVMTHDRAYKTAISRAEALDELRRCAGTQFDPGLVKVFTQMLN
ncbi:MAG: HD domain-containing phosphohydrolase [Syntrophomonas sp.]